MPAFYIQEMIRRKKKKKEKEKEKKEIPSAPWNLHSFPSMSRSFVLLTPFRPLTHLCVQTV